MGPQNLQSEMANAFHADDHADNCFPGKILSYDLLSWKRIFFYQIFLLSEGLLFKKETIVIIYIYFVIAQIFHMFYIEMISSQSFEY